MPPDDILGFINSLRRGRSIDAHKIAPIVEACFPAKKFKENTFTEQTLLSDDVRRAIEQLTTDEVTVLRECLGQMQEIGQSALRKQMN